MSISRTQSDFLNLARWTAAWLVLAEHARSLLFRDFTEAGGHGLLVKGFYFMTGFGHEAVMVFFVISGYLVGGKVWEKYRSGRFEWKGYLCDRVSRLHAVLLAALVCGWLLDTAGSKWFVASGLYNHQTAEPVAVVGRSFTDALGPGPFLGNLGFLQTIVVPPYGSNGPLWSLANEWWYYLLFPVTLEIALGRSPVRRILALAAMALMVWLLPLPILVLFGVWLLGVAVAAVPAVPLPWWIAAPASLGALCVARMEILPGGQLGSFLIGITFSLWLSSLGGRQGSLPLAKLSRRLADFSYSTYLLHFPLVVFAAAGLQSLSGSALRMSFAAGPLAIYGGVVGLAITASWALSAVTEAKTEVLRGWLRRISKAQTIREKGVLASTDS